MKRGKAGLRGRLNPGTGVHAELSRMTELFNRCQQRHRPRCLSACCGVSRWSPVSRTCFVGSCAKDTANKVSELGTWISFSNWKQAPACYMASAPENILDCGSFNAAHQLHFYRFGCSHKAQFACLSTADDRSPAIRRPRTVLEPFIYGTLITTPSSH